jgi:protein SMG6
LAKETTALGQAASAAIKYLETHVRSHALSLKIQTSKGNYLSDLFVRTEQIDFRDMGDLAQASSEDREIARAQTMDDFILRVAVSQSEHFVDRSRILSSSGSPLKLDAAFDDQKRTASKVLLLTFDRNLRLRARARGIEAADEKEMAKIFKRVNGPG